MNNKQLTRRVGRATIGSGIVFVLSLTLWISQRPEEEPKLEYPSWPDISWVIVTTTSTSTTVPTATDTSKPKRTTTTSSAPTTTTTAENLVPETTTVEAGSPTSTVAESSSVG